ncbi:54S ribosomal protein L7, mitochondrial [Wickerhamomyces ciferrii]|uniref:Large ribosomal subunit protein uL5m n=1 Tax=Wickerhamomyces ciferrii (strain ATCC 14091 / BCRC 22168 / CBS 111 / JCM 3599 / NBRC 0793 / NRRL Y-1031 F-60-10) TaxID=1206466 RepID=K0KBQ0_WICCF|nr:54S ribosomal protein L7, mitochondrial [Wickerhamomyces ciferrii]CCH42485.1 54S ribosomal protein L7, mitochondrial [Wickerhamomyces ciferrii]
MFSQKLVSQGNIRLFSTSSAAAGRVGCSLVKPVHHLIKIDKNKLSPRFPELNLEKNDIRNPGFRPVATHQDRVAEHYTNTLQSDLLLMNFQHNQRRKEGLKRRQWDGSSPNHPSRTLRKPKGSEVETPDIKIYTDKNIPIIESITLNCYTKLAKDNANHAISAALQLQQITNCKPKPLHSRKDVIAWGVRRGWLMGAKVELKGRPLSQFLSTLTEIVFPRIREFKGLSSRAGDKTGNLSMGLTHEEISFFPEIESNQDQWSKTYGMHINIKTTAQTDTEARRLLSAYGFPIHGTERKNAF